ncbi:MAG: hypothetical protein WCK17_15285 [Verrucomicrobiota bacterium]
MKQLFYLCIILVAAAKAHAQLDVHIDIKRHIFVRGEPIAATVHIRNLSGHDVALRDSSGHQWFGFEIMRGNDSPVAPHKADYKNDSLTILAGDSVSRTVDLLKLYPINEFATYKVRAAIYFEETKKYMISETFNVDISDGKKVWSETVGVPNGKEGAGQYHSMALISFQTPKELTLYVRVEDVATGTLFGTYPLGRLITGSTPIGEFDNENTLHAFHMTGPSQYMLSKIGVNGEWLGQSLWNAPKGRATVRKKPDGTMVVIGATKERPATAAALPVPKISDRPPISPPK